MKQHLVKLLIGLALLASLLGGIGAASSASAAVKVIPTQHLLACGADGFPPCE